MLLTFGKFKGWDTKDLAKAGGIGQNYLSWCTQNLDSPKWRKECEAALQNTTIDFELAVRAAMYNGLTRNEAIEWVNSEIESAQEMANWQNKEEQAESNLRMDLETCGLDQTQITELLEKFKWDFFIAIEEGTIKFSSQEKQVCITQAFNSFYDKV